MTPYNKAMLAMALGLALTAANSVPSEPATNEPKDRKGTPPNPNRKSKAERKAEKRARHKPANTRVKPLRCGELQPLEPRRSAVGLDELLDLNSTGDEKMKVTHEFEVMTEEKRPQDPSLRGDGWRFETLEHGGEYPDCMPQAIRATDAEGRSCIYLPVTHGGRIVDSKGFHTEV